MQALVADHSYLLEQFLPSLNGVFGRASEVAEQAPASSYKVLIVEASASLGKLLATGVANEASHVDVAAHAAAAFQYCEMDCYDLVILDTEMPTLDGADLLRMLLAKQPGARVLALGGQSGHQGLVHALDHGADDYLHKPFSLLELMARIRALRRRAAQVVVDTPRQSKLVLHRDRCSVERDGRHIDLTPRECALLEVLVENTGKAVSRAELTEKVWSHTADSNTNIVDVYIKYLRDKIDGQHEQKFIRTVRGMGYMLQA
jgi:DNA-binding response OmpR family regulator